MPVFPARTLRATLLTLLAFTALAAPASAELVAYDEDTNTFQDDSGLRLEPCADGPECGAPGPTDPVPWFSATASLGEAGTPTASYVANIEQAPADGTTPATVEVHLEFRGEGFRPNTEYSITHPYGTWTATSTNNGVLRVGEPAPCVPDPAVPGDACDGGDVLSTSIGPFLRWDARFGALPPAGHIGDGATPHPVIGSPRGTNYVLVEGPDAGGGGIDALFTEDFVVIGRIAEEAQLGFDDIVPPAVDFGAQVVGGPSGTRTVTVTNVGFAQLPVGTPTVTGNSFAIASETCPTSLPRGESCTVTLRFTPNEAGGKSGQLTIPTGSPDGDGAIELTPTTLRRVDLSGQGTPAPRQDPPAQEDPPAQQQQQPATQQASTAPPVSVQPVVVTRPQAITRAQLLAALQSAVSQTGSRLNGFDPVRLLRQRRIAQPFAFLVPGRVTITWSVPRGAALKHGLRIRGKRLVLAQVTGTRSAAGEAAYTVRLTRAGRRLIARARVLRVTLTGRFVPAASTGIAPVGTVTRFTLRR